MEEGLGEASEQEARASERSWAMESEERRRRAISEKEVQRREPSRKIQVALVGAL